MKYQIIQKTLLLFIFLNLVCFSGCLNKQNSSEKKEDNFVVNIFGDIEIIESKVSTNWITGCCGNFENHTKSGFYHSVTIWSNASYQIEGKIKNIGKEEIAFVKINISFLDLVGKKLFDLNFFGKSIIIQNLIPETLKEFSVNISVLDYHYYNKSISFEDSYNLFNKVEKLKFYINSMN